MKTKILLGLFLLGSMACSLVYADTVEEGFKAYEQKDYTRALSLWRPAADAGHVKAQFYLSVMYAHAYGVDHDGATSIRWLKKSANAGYAPAQFNLGNQYLNGAFVKADDSKAAYWWRKAAQQDFVPAQYNLASLYYFGRGIEKDEEQALYWFRKAAKGGSKRAENALKSLDAPLQQETATPPPKKLLAAVASKKEAPAEAAVQAGKTEPESHKKVEKPQSHVAAPLTTEQPASKPEKHEKPQTSVAATKAAVPEKSHQTAAPASSDAASWVRQQSAKSYTVQFLSSQNRAAAEKYVASNSRRFTLKIVPVHIKGKVWYVVVSGQFATRKAAKDWIEELSSEASPWPRSFGDLQKRL
ncbi:MAG: SEL1-like repeat protein [gamma proteobacterium symbiont of Bathyaustriella thionipta]|nr:SEL1-like repeat protein [gamma proteobacterium symbiont of Bathyaustriella thionipta]